jgi:hypothetical protein
MPGTAILLQSCRHLGCCCWVDTPSTHQCTLYPSALTHVSIPLTYPVVPHSMNRALTMRGPGKGGRVATMTLPWSVPCNGEPSNVYPAVV